MNNSDNTGEDVEGVGKIAEGHLETMLAFDRLPARVRALLAAAPCNIATSNLLDAYYAGAPEAALLTAIHEFVVDFLAKAAQGVAEGR